MKELLLGCTAVLLGVTLMTSCGKVVNDTVGHFMLPKAEQFGKAALTRELRARNFVCSFRAQQFNCTNFAPTHRRLAPYELYDHMCYNSYLHCLQAPNGRNHFHNK